MTLQECQRNYDNMLPSHAETLNVNFDNENDIQIYLDEVNEANREFAHLNYDLRGCYE